eukprot:TRINITY_DN3274_c0_g3_i3.p1 TRINITY_DN3274_c0_g3~~TRINITY_DN3274_c0_g3_i3.p1  ORF type:complete len:751 (+),score=165.03 TRINITY_DN3274_c0_g3_i3:249-2501(+)
MEEESTTPNRYNSLMSVLRSRTSTPSSKQYTPTTPPPPRFAPFGELSTTTTLSTPSTPKPTNPSHNTPNGTNNNQTPTKSSINNTPFTPATLSTPVTLSTPAVTIPKTTINGTPLSNNKNNNIKFSDDDSDDQPNKKSRSSETTTISKTDIISKTTRITTTTTTTTTTSTTNTPTKNEFHENLDFVSFSSEDSQIIIPPVWMQKDNELKISLAKEIHQFFDWAQPTQEETLMRNYVVSEITKVVKSLWPQGKVYLFGSFKTGLTLPSSDMDVMVDTNDSYDRNPINTLYHELNSQPLFCSNLQLISATRVPIIKLVSSITNYKVDICFNSIGGVDNSKIIQGYFKRYPLLRPLVYVLKYLLYQYAVNEPFTGGLGSYALCIMAVYHLRLFQNSSATPKWISEINQSHLRLLIGNQDTHISVNRGNLAYLLLDFLDFYGSFDYKLRGISIAGGSNGSNFLKYRHELGKRSLPDCLCIEDPHDPHNDVGRSTFAFNKVQQIFRNAHVRLVAPRMENLPSLKSFKFTTLLSRIIEVDQHVIDHRDKIQRMIMWMGNKIEESTQYQCEKDDDNNNNNNNYNNNYNNSNNNRHNHNNRQNQPNFTTNIEHRRNRDYDAWRELQNNNNNNNNNKNRKNTNNNNTNSNRNNNKEIVIEDDSNDSEVVEIKSNGNRKNKYPRKMESSDSDSDSQGKNHPKNKRKDNKKKGKEVNLEPDDYRENGNSDNDDVVVDITEIDDSPKTPNLTDQRKKRKWDM